MDEVQEVALVRSKYPLRNADPAEAARLRELEGLADAATLAGLDRIGVAEGWRCAELGAGAGSIARHLADRVGPSGWVTAVDRDPSQLGDLAERPNVEVVEADLCALELPASSYHLVHSRSVLMHLERPEEAVRRAVAALGPGGLAFFEETDGSPALEVRDGPDAFHRVMVPLAARWTFANRLPAVLRDLGLEILRHDTREEPLEGATPRAAFWQRTLERVAELSRQAEAAGLGRPFSDEDLAAMAAFLDQPGASLPFGRRHRVVARRPG